MAKPIIPHSQVHEQVLDAARSSPCGVASVAVALLTLAGGMIGLMAALRSGMPAAAGMWILAATPVAGMGLALGIASLCRRHEARLYGHCGLWLNGTIAIFAVPLGMAWLLMGR